MRATVERERMRGHFGWGNWEPWQFTATKSQPILGSIQVSKADMSRFEDDRLGCASESYRAAGCMYDGAICDGDPRPAYKLCLHKLGYTIAGFTPPPDSSAPKN
jgi:hypothetical protein